MRYYQLDVNEVLNNLKTNENGLTIEEAQKRSSIYGKNKLDATKKELKLIKFLREFKDLMILILLISSLISFVISLINKEPITDSIIIIAIVIINAILGFIQELKADKAIDSLKKCKLLK